MTPLISIPLCTYNGARYLAQQLDSLKMQTCQDYEVVVFDDGSTDGSLEILHEYARLDKRIAIHANATNLGFQRNFSQALSHCSGCYVAPCDQDDVWLPDKLSTLLAGLGDHSLSYCNSRMINANGESLPVRMSDLVLMVSTHDPAVFAFDNCVSGHAMLFRRELLESALPIPAGVFHDWWLAAVAAGTCGVIYCDRELVHYRQHAHSVTDISRSRRIAYSARPAGFRLAHLREVGARLDALGRIPRSQEFLGRLAALWRAREFEWLSGRLCGLMLRHGARLKMIRRRSRLKLCYEALQLLPGVRLKRLFNKAAYVDG